MSARATKRLRSILRVSSATVASASAGLAWRIFSADAERSDLYTWEAAAEAKPPISVPMMEPAMPICEASAKEVAAASPEAITAAKLKSSKMPFFSPCSCAPRFSVRPSSEP